RPSPSSAAASRRSPARSVMPQPDRRTVQCGCGDSAELSMKCPGCGYDRDSTATLCPECGCSLATWDASTPECWRRHRRARVGVGALAALAVLLLANGWTLTSWPPAQSSGFEFSFGWPRGIWVGRDRVSWGDFIAIGLVIDVLAVPAFAAIGAAAGYLL